MNTRVVRPEVIWAVLLMEAGLILPFVSVIAQGVPGTGVVSALVVLLLLPAGYIALRYVPVLRDPAWRVLAGFVLVTAWRLQVPGPEGEGPAVALARFLQIVVPAALGFALWWRGGALADIELTSEEIRTEFLVAGATFLMLLVVFHGMVSGDAVLLGTSVGLFTVSGLVAIVLARQDAADIAKPGSGRLLAVLVAVVPAGATLLVLGLLRPPVLAAFWYGLGRLIELALTPLGLLIAWLASLIPARDPSLDTLQPDILDPPPVGGNFAEIVAQQRLPDWVAWATLTLVFLLVLFLVWGILRILLDSPIIGRPYRRQADASDVSIDSVGDARSDARELFGWLLDWLRSHLRPAHDLGEGSTHRNTQAWLIYRTLLEWADQQGLKRRPTETTGELQQRLQQHAPEAAHVVQLVTTAFESERYGDEPPDHARLRNIEGALASLVPEGKWLKD